MNSLVSALTAEGAITSSTLWGEVATAAPLIITIFVFAFGYKVLKRVLKSGSKGKLNV